MSRHGETRASLSGNSSGGRGNDEAYCATCSRSFTVDASHCPHDGTKLVRFKGTVDTMIGRTLDGRYLIKKPIGEGGMGTVYLGNQISVDRDVAIKVVHPSISNEREAAKRFLREARLASRLNAPNIVNVYDFGQSDDGILYLVMEFVRGALLGDLLAAMGTIPPQRVVNMAMQLCDALDAAHSVGVVHRDLKPANIICVEDMPGRETVKVLDFGLAKSTMGGDSASMAGITSTHSLLGTPLYMAPEMIEGTGVDNRTDYYALGCILYELLTGAPPFNDSAIAALFAKHLQELPARLPPSVPSGISDIVMRLLAKKPGDRFQNAAELREALFHVASGTPSSGTPILHSQHGHMMSPFARVTPDPTSTLLPERPSSGSFDQHPNTGSGLPIWDGYSSSQVGPIPSSPNTGPVRSPVPQVLRPSAPGGLAVAAQSQMPRPRTDHPSSGWSGKKVIAIICAAVIAAIVITALAASGEAPTTESTTPSVELKSTTETKAPTPESKKPEIKSEVTKTVEPKIEPKIETKIETKIEPKIEPKIETKTAPKPEIKSHTKVVAKTPPTSRLNPPSTKINPPGTTTPLPFIKPKDKK